MTEQQKDAFWHDFCHLSRADQIAVQRFIRRVADARRAGESRSFVECAREGGNTGLIVLAEALVKNY